MKKVLSYIWQLPQNIIGLLYKSLIFTTKDYSNSYTDYKLFYKNSRGSVSLGKYIFVNINLSNLDRVIKHEVGHYKQSCLLGPLYLLVIGIPSITWATLHSYIPYFRKYNYYSFYTEKWANKLVGLK